MQCSKISSYGSVTQNNTKEIQSRSPTWTECILSKNQTYTSDFIWESKLVLATSDSFFMISDQISSDKITKKKEKAHWIRVEINEINWSGNEGN